MSGFFAPSGWPVEAAAWLLLDASLKAALLLAMAAGLALALRRAAPRTRQAVWGGALLAALLVPLLSAGLPAWEVGLLAEPAWMPPRVERAPAAASSGPAGPAGVGRDAIRSEPIGLAAQRDAVAEPAARGRVGVERPPARATGGRETETALRRAPTPTRAAPTAPPANRVGQGVLGLWLAGFLVLLAVQGVGLWRAAALTRGAQPPVSAAWPAALERARRRLALGRPIRLLVSSAIVSPMTWGVRRPVVLLPPAAEAWSAERRRIVLPCTRRWGGCTSGCTASSKRSSRGSCARSWPASTPPPSGRSPGASPSRRRSTSTAGSCGC